VGHGKMPTLSSGDICTHIRTRRFSRLKTAIFEYET
jgi:hypothetical protein